MWNCACVMSTSRRGFLRGRVQSDADVLRPPWSVRGRAFEDVCTRCGDCLTVCPSAILVAGPGGFPLVDFSRGDCSFCADCVSACGPGALRRDDAGVPPWRLEVVIGGACLALHDVECRVCGEVCGEAAIRFRPTLGGVARPLVDAARCTGGGACQAPCPVGAVALANQVE